MNRNDYMDLLRDYLHNYFSAQETEEIVRDYEEFFEMGLQSGKTAGEVIESLGSPKKVAKDLADELEVTKQKQDLTSNSFWQRTEAFVKLKALKAGQHLDKSVPVVKEKMTDLLQNKEDNIFKKVLRFFARVGGILVKIIFFLLLLSVSLSLIGFGITSIFVIGLGIAFFTVNVPLGFAIMFGGFILMGFLLIGYEIVRYVYKSLIVLSKKMQTWWRYRVVGGAVGE